MQWAIPAYKEILTELMDEYHDLGKGKRGTVLNTAVQKIMASSKKHKTPLPDNLLGVRASHLLFPNQFAHSDNMISESKQLVQQ